MTILTKIADVKKDKLVVPLVENEHINPSCPSEDVESAAGGAAPGGARQPRIIIFPARATHRVSAVTTLCLLLTALSVVGVGIVGGKILYNEFLSVSQRPQRARLDGWAQIPMRDEYDMPNDEMTEDNYPPDSPEKWIKKNAMQTKMDLDDIKEELKNYFQENFQIDDDEKYEKIDVPDFRDGRSGRFIHDFNTNITGIIDITGHRCFVMPLNRDHVLPPKSLFDLIHKMWDGYYKVDTEVVRKSMHVVIPPIQDTESIGMYIANECEGLPIYRLEKYEEDRVKRSADLHPEAKFAQFAGKGITEFDIVNLDEVREYERTLVDSPKAQ